MWEIVYSTRNDGRANEIVNSTTESHLKRPWSFGRWHRGRIDCTSWFVESSSSRHCLLQRTFGTIEVAKEIQKVNTKTHCTYRVRTYPVGKEETLTTRGLSLQGQLSEKTPRIDGEVGITGRNFNSIHSLEDVLVKHEETARRKIDQLEKLQGNDGKAKSRKRKLRAEINSVTQQSDNDTGNISRFPKQGKNCEIQGFYLGFHWNFPVWESATKPNHGTGLSQYFPNVGIEFSQYLPIHGIFCDSLFPLLGFYFPTTSPMLGLVFHSIYPFVGFYSHNTSQSLHINFPASL